VAMQIKPTFACVRQLYLRSITGKSVKNFMIIEYEEYIEKKSTLYEQFKKLYIQAYEKDVFYKKCKYYNPKNAIPKLKCEKKISEREKSKAASHDHCLLDPTQFSGQKSDSTKTFGYVFLGVVVPSMTSGLLYKFTPLGSRLRNGFEWIKYKVSNVNEEENILFSQKHESFNPNNDDREHYIGYHTA
ncbi:hypothetical protein PCYB_001930, partial [Plasmodium cynomolgi strain B]